MHLNIRPQEKSLYYPHHPYIDFLTLARDFLSPNNPTTLTIDRDPADSSWRFHAISTESWQAIRPNWTRLEALHSVNCSCFLNLNEADEEGPFFTGGPSISFSCEVTDEVEEMPRRMSNQLGTCGVFSNPFVLANGIDLYIGDDEKDRAAAEELAGKLEVDFRSLVRYR
jgi:hypothetical protein